ncbi:benzoate 4-monooxygenase cytochrome P450 [Corynespora cassiicola Philippines]|uniref:Benzoate 4-monooxygenase cytochrome P450 n=1 Tax=Corynespora cassiicola Philippines TaxID=1448308 RepID=A0A2T2NII4_CORCC|nr:benzoate 4-monooxygenase cytochrome P450 [Corynespora cassiicola Philippines]
MYVLCYATYLAFFHPLSKFPGPKLRAAFYLPFNWEIWTGRIGDNWHALHEEYGDIVRISPTMISVIQPEAWRDIYGHFKTPIPKDPNFYFRDNGVADIIMSNDADHTRFRRLLNHAFSDQALRAQEDIINSYISLLISQLAKKASSDTPVDMTRYMGFAAFDILGDLCFDESFDALKNEDWDWWTSNTIKSRNSFRILRFLRAYPILGFPVMTILKLFPSLNTSRYRHRMHTMKKTSRRLDTETDRKDFISYILKHNDEKGMTRPEIMSLSRILITAGSETSASLLSGAIYYLLQSPEWMSKLQSEIRDSFKEESDMTFTSLRQAKVLNAVIQETFRMYPPVPGPLLRLVQKEGAVVCGKYFPAGCSIGVPQHSAYRSPRNFKYPDIFAPQRFLDDPEFKEDKKSVLQPFSVGPRNCIGQNLAMSEIRLILARLVWHFDMQLEQESQNWRDQRSFVFWDKSALMVRLTQRS